MKNFTRITVDPNQMGGLPCIRGLRIPVATVVGMVGEGMPEAEILSAYHDLEIEDVREAPPTRLRPSASGSFPSPWFLTLDLQRAAIEGKIVLPCKPRFQRKGRSSFRVLFGAGLAFVPVIRSMPTSRPGALC